MKTYTWDKRHGTMYLNTNGVVEEIPVSPDTLKKINPGVKIHNAVHVPWEDTEEGIAAIDEYQRAGKAAPAREKVYEAQLPF